MQNKTNFWRLIAVLIAILLLVWFIAQFFPMDQKPGPSEQKPQTPTSQIRHDASLDFLDANGAPIVSIEVEIADNDQTRTAGLMGRTRIAEKEGMLFLFDTEEPRAFWMANTPLPLDILFVNTAGSIVKIHRHTQPYSQESLPSNSPAQFVVEVNAGFCDKHGIVEGNTVTWNRY